MEWPGGSAGGSAAGVTGSGAALWAPMPESQADVAQEAEMVDGGRIKGSVAQRPCGDHLQPIRLRFHGKPLF